MAQPPDTRPPFAPPFAIFRARDAKDYADEMTSAPLTETQIAGSAKMVEAGVLEGTTVKLLYARPGMSLSWAWFKSGFPLPRHSHDVDCLYFIVAGSLKIGVEELGPGDGFFVGRDVPYAYTPGERGVEVLEFRTADAFDIRLLADGANYWDKAMAQLHSVRPHWPGETAPPSGISMG